MYIPVVLKNGEEMTVEKNRFQELISGNKILFFKRTGGWVVVGRDQLRGPLIPYQGVERRNREVYSTEYWC